MKPRTSIILAGIAVVVLVLALVFGHTGTAPSRPDAVAPGTLVFPGLAAKLQQAARVEITSKGQTLAITRKGDTWGLPDRGNYPVQQDKLREVLTGLTELRLTEPRTAEPSLYERLGVGDPGAATSTANLVRVLDGSGHAIAELIVGHRRVRTQGNVPEGIYVRRPGEAQSWLAEGRLPVDADPQLWLDRDIANIGAAKVSSVLVNRGDEALQFGRDGEKPVLKTPEEHPKLDDYRVEDVFRALETLTLTDVRPAAQEPGEKIGTATFATADGTVVDATVFRADKDIWVQLAVHGDNAEAKQLSARTAGWTFEVGSWKEKAFVPTLADLKASEPEKPAAAPGASTPEGTPPPGAGPAEAPKEATPPAAAADQKKPEAAADQKKPEAAADQKKPEAAADQKKPEAAADQTKPDAAADQTKSDAAADQKKPE